MAAFILFYIGYVHIRGFEGAAVLDREKGSCPVLEGTRVGACAFLLFQCVLFKRFAYFINSINWSVRDDFK